MPGLSQRANVAEVAGVAAVAHVSVDARLETEILAVIGVH